MGTVIQMLLGNRQCSAEVVIAVWKPDAEDLGTEGAMKLL